MNISIGLAGFVEFMTLYMTGSDYLSFLMLITFIGFLFVAAFGAPLEIVLPILYMPIIVICAFNSEMLKAMLVFILYLAILLMKYLTMNK